MSDQAATTHKPSGPLAEARALFEAKDLEGAERKLNALTTRGTAPLGAYQLHSTTLLRLGREQEALKVTRDGLAKWPRDKWLVTALADMLQSSLPPEQAHQQLLKALETDPDNPFLQAAVAETSLSLGAVSEAQQRIGRAVQLAPEDSTIVLDWIVIFAIAGANEEAAQCMVRAKLAEDDVIGAFRRTLKALNRLKRKEEVYAALNGLTTLLPGKAVPLVWSAEVLLRDRRPAEALEHLDRTTQPTPSMAPDIAFRFLSAKGKALGDLDRREEAMDIFEKALLLKPDSEDVLRELYVLAQKLGLEDKRKSYGRRISASGSKTLPATLAAGLAALKDRKLSVAMDARAQWAWELADKNEWREADWLSAVAWGQAADKLLRSWWLNAHDRGDEIDSLVDRPANTAFDALAPDAKCLCVTTHMGPLAASVRYIQTVGRPFRGYGVAGPDPVTDDGPPMRIAQSGGSEALRHLIEEIDKGTLIGFAAELPDSSKALELDFLGRKITLSTMVPRLIWKQRTACIWWQALWRDGRIVIEVERLPDPNPGELIEPWCRRWADAYLERVGRVMRGQPENLNLRGIWGNVG